MKARTPASIEMYAGSLPQAPFVEVGLLSTQGGDFLGAPDSAALAQELRTRAAAMGCDALTNVHSSLLRGPYHTQVGLEGTCAVYLVPPAPGSSASAQLPRGEADLREGAAALASRYETGDGVGKDPARAAELYQKACTAGEAEACSHLGWMYEKGVGVAADGKHAAALYQSACAAGVLIACVRGQHLHAAR